MIKIYCFYNLFSSLGYVSKAFVMFFVYGFVLLLFLTSPSFAKNITKKHVSNQSDVLLIESTYQTIASGINGGGNSKEYYFKIKIITEKKIIFDTLWVANTSYKTYVANNKKYIDSKPITFTKNDTVTVRVSEQNINNKHDKINAPITYSGDGLLRYFVNGKPNFLTIKSIKSIKGLNRP